MIPISGGYSLTRACRETTMHDFHGHACVAVWSVVMWEGCRGSPWKCAHSTWDQHAKHAHISCFWVCPFMYHECSVIQAHMLPFMHGLVFTHVHAFCIHGFPHLPELFFLWRAIFAILPCWGNVLLKSGSKPRLEWWRVWGQCTHGFISCRVHALLCLSPATCPPDFLCMFVAWSCMVCHGLLTFACICLVFTVTCGCRTKPKIDETKSDKFSMDFPCGTHGMMRIWQTYFSIYIL